MNFRDDIYQNTNLFPGTPVYNGNGINTPDQGSLNSFILPTEQSYIENILRLNKGKKVEVFMSYTDSSLWRDKTFDGIIEEAGRDHLIISDPKDGNWYLLQMIYLDYIKFYEPIAYNKEFSKEDNINYSNF